MSSRMAACIFCKIIKGEIPSFKLFESEKTLAFMDIQPLSKGHALIIPKYHGEKLADIPDEHLTELLPVAKKIAIASGAKDYNILQNNGKIAHQEVGHVHVHIVSFPGIEEVDPALLPGAKRSTVPQSPLGLRRSVDRARFANMVPSAFRSPSQTRLKV
ncbi:hypothetical protein FJTKL_14972 [Diaporthe vaccinii]|uniref:HIT domain-containing protein n=1 Tax=Diaporthe vaccinii TaxID=105482 RepID=A0ABR4E6E1_9PEZI